MTAVRRGIGFTPMHTREEMIECAILADELGYYSVGVPEAWGYDSTLILTEIAADRGDDPVDVAVDLACGWGMGSGIYFSQSEADVREFLQRPWVATASDGVAIMKLLGRWAHPRLYGTFPRKIRSYPRRSFRSPGEDV